MYIEMGNASQVTFLPSLNVFQCAGRTAVEQKKSRSTNNPTITHQLTGKNFKRS